MCDVVQGKPNALRRQVRELVELLLCGVDCFLGLTCQFSGKRKLCWTYLECLWALYENRDVLILECYDLHGCGCRRFVQKGSRHNRPARIRGISEAVVARVAWHIQGRVVLLEVGKKGSWIESRQMHCAYIHPREVATPPQLWKQKNIIGA